jgi:secernin
MCDTFVAVGSATADNSVIFGKNSDRPYDERQPLVFFPRKKFPSNSTIKCTHITIPQVDQTYAILLSKPSWMWGGEMGTNEFGVTIGNEAVWTKEPYRGKGLLGMDLLRLTLERCSTAFQGIELITHLLEDPGQGGQCAEHSNLTYHNSFLIADSKEAWVLETAGSWWVAQKIKEGVRNISNNLSIRSDFDLAKEGLLDYAIDQNFIISNEEFDFAKIFSEGYYREPSLYSRDGFGYQCLQDGYGSLDIQNMMEILRDHSRGICMHGGFRTTASQVSWIQGEKQFHWFTLSPHPCISIFKPFYLPSFDHKQEFDLWNDRIHLGESIHTEFHNNLLNLEESYIEQTKNLFDQKKTDFTEFPEMTKNAIFDEQALIAKYR